MSNNIKIELHLIQNFAPSCLNRDVTNTPKDCEFGGVRRARISSQCIKKSDRDYFRESGSVDVGFRSKLLKQELARRLESDGKPAEEVSSVLDAFLATYYSKMDEKKCDQTAVLLYVGEPEITEAVSCVRRAWDVLLAFDAERRKAKEKESKKEVKPPVDKEIAKRLKEAGKSADIALFGRMLAENPEMRTDAACQVAHAISTHRADLDLDFYTAVDDLNPASETGAGMMGETGFNSACFYRYSLIDRPQLVENLGEEKLADKVIRAFIEASVKAIPTGKQNSFAAQNPPSFGMIVVRKNGSPCSLANAFANPVRVKPGMDEDLVGLSIEALDKLHTGMKRVYGDLDIISEAVFQVNHDDRLGNLAALDKGSLAAAIDLTMAAVGRAAEV